MLRQLMRSNNSSSDHAAPLLAQRLIKPHFVYISERRFFPTIGHYDLFCNQVNLPRKPKLYKRTSKYFFVFVIGIG